MNRENIKLDEFDAAHEFRLKYWGVTGSFATPLTPSEVTDKVADCIEYLSAEGKLQDITAAGMTHAQIVKYLSDHVPFQFRSSFGGNTTCFEVTTRDGVIILDAGSGLRNLGADIVRRWQMEEQQQPTARVAHLLLTHGHMDHTFAIPFAPPLFDPRNAVTIWAPERVIESLHAVLRSDSELHGTFFPATYDVLPGIREFRTVEVGTPFWIGETEVVAYALNHPGSCVAYALRRNDTRLVFASDHEHLDVPDLGLAEFARDADLLYLDAQYFANEYQGKQGIGADPAIARVGWGHSTVEAAIKTAVASRVKRLHLGHHDPARSDRALAELAVLAKQWLATSWNSVHGEVSCPMEMEIVHEGMMLEL